MTKKKKNVHLVCNAHLDPVWRWSWEEGLAEALSTFRVAADFCERYDGFVFNHNEALLYHWVEQHEPELHQRIRRLVRQGRWHIAGGAWLQPDVNAPSGECHVRQYLYGLRYFRERFGVRPRVAYNFDPFGHAEGFQQVLAGCGMQGYVYCRGRHMRGQDPRGIFRWRDRSGVEIPAHRSDLFYVTRKEAGAKMRKHTDFYQDEPTIIALWGLGNHGGGPSAEQYEDIKRCTEDDPNHNFIDSTPEAFFDEAERLGRLSSSRILEGGQQESFPGCYTSMARYRHLYRETENLMFQTERLAALAWWQGRHPWPAKDLSVAWKDLLFGAFHDILPGSGTPAVERDSAQLLGHACDQLRRLRARTTIALLRGQRPAEQGACPVFVFNPHAHPFVGQVECEFPLDYNWHQAHTTTVELRVDGKRIPQQEIRPDHNLHGNDRARVAMRLRLPPFGFIRVDGVMKKHRKPKPPSMPKPTKTFLRMASKKLAVHIDPRTGLLDHLRFGTGDNLVGTGAFMPVIYPDVDHSWTSADQREPSRGQERGTGFRPHEDEFRLATTAEAQELSPRPKGVTAKPINVVEHGPLRTVIEAVFVCGPSVLVREYIVGLQDGLFEIRDRLIVNHRDKMFKLLVPLAFPAQSSRYESVFSADVSKPTVLHEEHPHQRWVAVDGPAGETLAIINDGTNGHSLTETELGLSMVRTPPFCAMYLKKENPWHSDRFIARMDMGEHHFRWQVHGGQHLRESAIVQAADAMNIAPHPQVYYPQPGGPKEAYDLGSGLSIDTPNVVLTAAKKAERGNGLILRLREVDGRKTTATLRLPDSDTGFPLTLAPYRVLTVQVRRRNGTLVIREINMVEGY